MNYSNIFLIIIGILYLAYQRGRNKTIKTKSLLVLPVLFLYFLYETVTKNQLFMTMNLILIFSGVAIGTFCGFMLRKTAKVKLTDDPDKIIIQGDWMDSILFLIIVSLQFFSHYILAAFNPTPFSLLLNGAIFVMAIATGLTVGRNIRLFVHYLALSSNCCNH